jgi:hypothetical protein
MGCVRFAKQRELRRHVALRLNSSCDARQAGQCLCSGLRKGPPSTTASHTDAPGTLAPRGQPYAAGGPTFLGWLDIDLASLLVNANEPESPVLNHLVEELLFKELCPCLPDLILGDAWCEPPSRKILPTPLDCRSCCPPFNAAAMPFRSTAAVAFCSTSAQQHAHRASARHLATYTRKAGAGSEDSWDVAAGLYQRALGTTWRGAVQRRKADVATNAVLDDDWLTPAATRAELRKVASRAHVCGGRPSATSRTGA